MVFYIIDKETTNKRKKEKDFTKREGLWLKDEEGMALYSF